jgi:GTPase SAR1 family protein
MGCGASAPADAPARQLVLLGGGECGKTTIFKQMQILHGAGFGDKAHEWIEPIHRSPLRAMKIILDAMKQRDTFSMLPLEAEGEKINKEDQELTVLTMECAMRILAAWKCDEVQAMYKVKDDPKTKLDLDDNAKYFLDEVVSLAKPGYKPTTDEILMVRDPTRTIETIDFKYGKALFRVIDVGGQRMERPKWNLTGDITAVIFVFAMTEYNQTLREDVKMNRMKESLNLFDIACNRRYPDKPILLFGNKNDLFEAKIKKYDLKICFPSYKAGCEYQPAVDYMKTKFLNARKDKEKDVFVMWTTATDTKNMEFIISSMLDIVEKQNLNSDGF